MFCFCFSNAVPIFWKKIASVLRWKPAKCQSISYYCLKCFSGRTIKCMHSTRHAWSLNINKLCPIKKTCWWAPVPFLSVQTSYVIKSRRVKDLWRGGFRLCSLSAWVARKLYVPLHSVFLPSLSKICNGWTTSALTGLSFSSSGRYLLQWTAWYQM